MHSLRALLVSGALLGGSVVGSACASTPTAGPVSIAPPSDASGAKESWNDVVGAHTRRVQPYKGPIRQADMRATLVTPRLRKAFLDARAEFHGKFSEEAAQELVGLGNPDEGVDAPMKSAPDAEQQILVFVAMYVTDQPNRDISASYTIWETRLVRGDASVKPLGFETIKNTPAVVDMFPHVDRFDDLYLVRFPLVDEKGRPLMAPGGEPLRLEVRSALADAVVEWSLRE